MENSETVKPIDRPLEQQKRAIVIGASSGIGAALVRELSRRGYLVAAIARREEMLTALAENINASANRPQTVIPIVHDVTEFDQIPSLFEEVTERLSGCDMVIFNAGVMPEVDPEEYDFAKDRLQVEVNLLGAMAWLNEAAKRFRRLGSGYIVGISSVSGDRGRTANPGYHTSKGGLSIYLESLRNRLSRHGVSVTTIKPGFVETEMLKNAKSTFWVISPEVAARQIIDAAEKKRQTAYIPARWGLVMLIIRHIPSFIFRRLDI